MYHYFPSASFVSDIFHLLQHLDKTAYCFRDEASPEAKEFVNHWLRMLLQGKVGKLIGGLKRMRIKRKLSGAANYGLGQAIGYPCLERNRSHNCYSVCLGRGYPIGSGVIEGACPNLINDGLEPIGMRWTLSGAESVMAYALPTSIRIEKSSGVSGANRTGAECTAPPWNSRTACSSGMCLRPHHILTESSYTSLPVVLDPIHVGMTSSG